MVIISRASIPDWTPGGLIRKKKEAVKRLLSGNGYKAFVWKADGSIIQFSLSSETKRGYTQRTLKPSEYVLY